MRTCLVVDDSSVIRKVARRIRESLDFQSVEADDGAKALDACKRAMPEAVLLDWNMPVMDGYEFLGNLRRMPGGDAPKVVFCTTGTWRLWTAMNSSAICAACPAATLSLMFRRPPRTTSRTSHARCMPAL